MRVYAFMLVLIILVFIVCLIGFMIMVFFMDMGIFAKVDWIDPLRYFYNFFLINKPFSEVFTLLQTKAIDEHQLGFFNRHQVLRG